MWDKAKKAKEYTELKLPDKQQKRIIYKNNIAPIKKLLMMLFVPVVLAVCLYMILLKENNFNQRSPLVPIVIFSFIAAPFVFGISIALWKDQETTIILTNEDIISKQPLSKECRMSWNDIKGITIGRIPAKSWYNGFGIELVFTRKKQGFLSNHYNRIYCLIFKKEYLSGDAANFILKQIDVYQIPIKGKKEHLEEIRVNVESE